MMHCRCSHYRYSWLAWRAPVFHAAKRGSHAKARNWKFLVNLRNLSRIHFRLTGEGRVTKLDSSILLYEKIVESLRFGIQVADKAMREPRRCCRMRRGLASPSVFRIVR